MTILMDTLKCIIALKLFEDLKLNFLSHLKIDVVFSLWDSLAYWRKLWILSEKSSGSFHICFSLAVGLPLDIYKTEYSSYAIIYHAFLV